MQAVSLGAGPDISLRIFEQRENTVVAQLGLELRRCRWVAERVESLGGSNPQNAVCAWQERFDACSVELARANSPRTAVDVKGKLRSRTFPQGPIGKTAKGMNGLC